MDFLLLQFFNEIRQKKCEGRKLSVNAKFFMKLNPDDPSQHRSRLIVAQPEVVETSALNGVEEGMHQVREPIT